MGSPNSFTIDRALFAPRTLSWAESAMALFRDFYPSPTLPPSGSVELKGDADCNGHVDVHDVLAALNLAAGARPGASCAALADVDCDGSPDAEDALRILDFVGGTAPLPQPSGCAGVGTLTSG
jgi:hypothetical protein